MLFRLWESVNSYMFDDRMLQFLARLAEMHVDPTVSDPERIHDIPDDARSDGEERPNWSKDDLETKWKWSGLFSDVGIFSEADWSFIMAKCMASMGKSIDACKSDAYLHVHHLGYRDSPRRRWLPNYGTKCGRSSDFRNESATQA